MAGRPGAQVNAHFVQLKHLEKAPGNYWYSECRYCQAAFSNCETASRPVRIIGRPRNYKNHLDKCKHYKASLLQSTSPLSAVSTSSHMATAMGPQAISSRAQSHGEMEEAGGGNTAVSPHPQAKHSLALSKRRAPLEERDVPLKKRHFSRSEVYELERSLVEMNAANHLSDRFIEDETVLRVFELICPGISDIIPSRRVLGGRLLKSHANWCIKKADAALRTIQQRTGGSINLLSDVWQNISKDHLLGCQLSLFGVLLTYGLPSVSDRHDGLAIAEQLESVLKKAQDDGWDVGAMVTDDAGQCGRARRVLSLRWPNICFLFCFAHAINNLVKAVIKTSFRDVACQAAGVVNCLNASSSKWLLRAKKLIKKFYGRTFGLRSLCQIRWNSMQGCFASLLRVQSSLQMLHRQFSKDDDYPAQLNVLGSSFFWSNLKRAEAVISPLSYASYRLQRDENTVGDVLLSYRDIFRGFNQDVLHSNELVKCVEHRWMECEQPLFLLGYALHPVYAEYARGLSNTAISGAGSLPKVAVYYFRKLFNTEEVGTIKRDMFSWMENRFTRTRPSEFDNCPWEYWEYIAKENPKSLLPKLAMRVLSIAVNTATCERLFSELGIIHTAKRNRLASDKTLDIQTVAQHVRQRALKHEKTHSKKKLLVCPDEREIVRDTLVGMFTPPPPVAVERNAGSEDADGDDDDPGDGADGEETMALWTEYLDEVFEDEELDTGYEEAHSTLNQHVEGGADEFETIALPVLHEFPTYDDPAFPQEKKLTGFRGQKVTLVELFG